MASLAMPLNVAGFARDAPELWSSCGQVVVKVLLLLLLFWELVMRATWSGSAVTVH